MRKKKEGEQLAAPEGLASKGVDFSCSWKRGVFALWKRTQAFPGGGKGLKRRSSFWFGGAGRGGTTHDEKSRRPICGKKSHPKKQPKRGDNVRRRGEKKAHHLDLLAEGKKERGGFKKRPPP